VKIASEQRPAPGPVPAGRRQPGRGRPDRAGRPRHRDLLNRYVDAFTRADPAALATLLRADAELEMPPIPLWFTSRAAVTGFLARRVMRPGRWHLVPARANTQSAVLVYLRTADGQQEPYGVQVLTMTGARIARITSFNDPALVPLFTGARSES
jgi:RNA polymerase sigma-70 factor (ECF subfamily)